MQNSETTVNGSAPRFNVGDKVRHERDIEYGSNDYGTGTVTGILYDNSGGFYYYNVEFPTGRGQWITQYNYWDIRKVG